MPRRLARRLIQVMLALSLACGATVGLLVWRYPGFASAGWNYLRYSSQHERVNVATMLRYWLSYVGAMRQDSQGFYTFDDVEGDTPFERARLDYHRGEFARAVTAIEAEIAAGGESEESLFWLAMAQLRRGESENCLEPVLHGAVIGHGSLAEYCVLPVRRIHTDKGAARAAAAGFRTLIETYDHDNRLYHWLLTYASMIAGDFPDQVPPQYRPSAAFIDRFFGPGREAMARRHRHLRFEERAAEAGVATHNAGRGVAVEDFDRDGRLDIVTGGSFDDLRYYHGEVGGTFSDWTDRGGMAGLRQPFFISVADYDNDGWFDLVATHMFHDGFRLLRNLGNGTFTDVTATSGLWDARPEGAVSSAWATAWADIDLDGDLDVFQPQMGMDIPFVGGLLARPRFPSAVFINEAGRFVDRTAEYGMAPIVGDRYFVGAAFGDYDRDGYPDLYLSSPIPGESVLLRNRDGRGFARIDVVDWHGGGFTTAFVDVNHDGRLDIFQAGFSDARSSIEMAMYGAPESEYRGGRNVVLLQTEAGRFVEASGFFDMPGGTMGASFGDVDNDGCYDFYLGTGSPEGWFIFPNLMFVGVPDGRGCALRTDDVSALNDVASAQKGHGIVFADLDGDGLQDIYSSLGGMWPGDRWPNQFLLNRSEVAGHWVKFRLRGTRTNQAGIGARVRVEATTVAGDPVVRYLHMDQKTGFGSGPYLAHMGLGQAASIRTVEVYWPVSRCTGVYAARIDSANVFDERCGGGPAAADGEEVKR